MPLFAIAPDDSSRPSAAPETAIERAARRFARGFLLERVRDRLGGSDGLWFEDCLAAVAESDPLAEPRTFDLAFGLVPERLGRVPLATAGARECLRRNADACLPGWRPMHWRLDEAARALLVTAAGDEATPALLERAVRDADVDVRIALLRALPLLPTDDAVVALVRRALACAARPVLEAIAHENPWPARHLGDEDWNRLVLTALALDSPLDPIDGLEWRANAALATALIAHARERRAAGRAVPTALWSALGPFATLETLGPFLRSAALGDPYGPGDLRVPDGATRAALARAVLASSDPALGALAADLSRFRPRLAGEPGIRHPSTRAARRSRRGDR